MIGLIMVASLLATTQLYAQASDLESIFSDFEAAAKAGTPHDVADANRTLEGLTQASKESMNNVLPTILHETASPYPSVRGLATMALFAISTRPDGLALISGDTSTFRALLVDEDIPIRRVDLLVMACLHPGADFPLIPDFVSYLDRQDAVSTIGAGVATLLMQAAPNDPASIYAVVQFMRRKDQTAESRGSVLDGVRYAKSTNPEVGKEVAAYADDPDEQVSVLAIQVLRGMGPGVVMDNRQSLSRIAADTRRAASVRDAAAKALSAAQRSATSR